MEKRPSNSEINTKDLENNGFKRRVKVSSPTATRSAEKALEFIGNWIDGNHTTIGAGEI